MLRTSEQILSDAIIGKTIKSVKYDGFDAKIEFTDGETVRLCAYHDSIEINLNDESPLYAATPEFISETEWRKENGHTFSKPIIDKYGKK